ncbi:uncharacterized protein UMAG_10495 [Mycosarcoma maydis]|uniref:Uncharacterized protein n=1 Tax=Mycosarcoma maydis TaxID=5270 RepID=A0A0D1C366_MYCMD|nr:uncharacterized protein UMAG_10495 [Ustilago maydis 521]KIS68137.1 hypothetical protein UMAG_10495 [Ustilago maydis 521]|eukprot:XP_011390318.1 hypothetical protein UMAG_10495 [Ustilago maydis 521]
MCGFTVVGRANHPALTTTADDACRPSRKSRVLVRLDAYKVRPEPSSLTPPSTLMTTLASCLTRRCQSSRQTQNASLVRPSPRLSRQSALSTSPFQPRYVRRLWQYKCKRDATTQVLS